MDRAPLFHYYPDYYTQQELIPTTTNQFASPLPIWLLFWTFFFISTINYIGMGQLTIALLLVYLTLPIKLRGGMQ